MRIDFVCVKRIKPNEKNVRETKGRKMRLWKKKSPLKTQAALFLFIKFLVLHFFVFFRSNVKILRVVFDDNQNSISRNNMFDVFFMKQNNNNGNNLNGDSSSSSRSHVDDKFVMNLVDFSEMNNCEETNNLTLNKTTIPSQTPPTSIITVDEDPTQATTQQDNLIVNCGVLSPPSPLLPPTSSSTATYKSSFSPTHTQYSTPAPHHHLLNNDEKTKIGGSLANPKNNKSSRMGSPTTQQQQQQAQQPQAGLFVEKLDKSLIRRDDDRERDDDCIILSSSSSSLSSSPPPQSHSQEAVATTSSTGRNDHNKKNAYTMDEGSYYNTFLSLFLFFFKWIKCSILILIHTFKIEHFIFQDYQEGC